MNLFNENTKYVLNSRGLNLYSVEWLPANNNPRAIVFICNGYGEHMHSGYFETLARPLIEIDFLVSGHDYAGHGRSEGRRGHFDNIDRTTEDVIMFIRILKSKYSTLPLFILGYSFGGIVAILAVIKYPELFQGIILESAALDYNRKIITSSLICMGTFLGYCCPNMIIRRFTDDLSKNDHHRIQYLRAGTAHFLICAIKSIHNKLCQISIPIFAVHGKQDPIIPYHSTVNLINTVSSMDRSLTLYNHTSHDIRYDDQKDNFSYIEELKQWLLARI